MWAESLLRELGLEALSQSRRVTAPDSDHLIKIVPSAPSSAFAQGIAAGRLDLHRAELLPVHSLQQRALLDEEMLLETGAQSMAVDTLSLDHGISGDFATHYAWLPSGRFGILIAFWCGAEVGDPPPILPSGSVVRWNSTPIEPSLKPTSSRAPLRRLLRCSEVIR